MEFVLYADLYLALVFDFRIDFDFRFDDAMAGVGCTVYSFDPR